MADLASIDQELRTLHDRHERAVDLLVRCLVDMAAMEYRMNVLLDRRLTVVSEVDA